jgi:hypothetical protein
MDTGASLVAICTRIKVRHRGVRSIYICVCFRLPLPLPLLVSVRSAVMDKPFSPLNVLQSVLRYTATHYDFTLTAAAHRSKLGHLQLS